MPLLDSNNFVTGRENYTGDYVVGQQYFGKTYKGYDDSMVSSWTTDQSKGDNQNFTVKDGQVLYPIWKNSLTGVTKEAQSQYEELSDPNSSYYQKVSKQIRSSLTGAYSPDSLLALTVAMGGSPTQAKEQMKALEGKISDTTGNLTNQLYLGAQNTAGNYLNSMIGTVETQKKYDYLEQQQQDSLLNSILSGIGGIAGNYLGGSGAEATTNNNLTPLQQSTMSVMGQSKYWGW
jgi:hypothetical protein